LLPEGRSSRAFAESVRFLRTGFQPDDWIAVFLKNYQSGRVAQRMGPLSWVMSDHVLAWLSAMNAARFNVFCSVNVFRSGQRSRSREVLEAIRHVFLDVDHDGDGVLARLGQRDIPAPSYVLTSSPGRLHIFWRVTGFDTYRVEAVQKQLARDLGTDTAATSVSQLTRLAGFDNRKYETPFPITVAYGDVDRVFTPHEFPPVREITIARPVPVDSGLSHSSAIERARLYIDRVPPAIAGQHGDVRTFRVCCALVRGFALQDDEALTVLKGWNDQCQPPWSDVELRAKLQRARKYGREPIGGLLACRHRQNGAPARSAMSESTLGNIRL
jgi:hypothetical protein